jgi:glyoxylase-like metal-dependent hydrolase (beta-lactamase superfamily II)
VRAVRKPTRPRELGRGERVLPGVWRLRLPLHLPGVPHCNAWVLRAGDGIVLVDTGMHERGSMADIERALAVTGHRVEDIRLIAITHAHIDHCGQAPPLAERAGCEVWIHPAFRLHVADRETPERALDRALEVARQSGVPEEPLQRWAQRRAGIGNGQAGKLRSDRDLLPGVEIATDVGVWQVYETPGHAPSHVCLHQPERRLLISGDHLLGRVSLYFDVGYTPDPVGEFLRSLDVVDGLDARLALAGHARPFTDLHGHVQANRELVQRRLEAVREALADGSRTAHEVALAVYGSEYAGELAAWRLAEARAWLTHLRALGEASTEEQQTPESWSLRS